MNEQRGVSPRQRGSGELLRWVVTDLGRPVGVLPCRKFIELYTYDSTLSCRFYISVKVLKLGN